MGRVLLNVVMIGVPVALALGGWVRARRRRVDMRYVAESLAEFRPSARPSGNQIGAEGRLASTAGRIAAAADSLRAIRTAKLESLSLDGDGTRPLELFRATESFTDRFIRHALPFTGADRFLKIAMSSFRPVAGVVNPAGNGASAARSSEGPDAVVSFAQRKAVSGGKRPRRRSRVSGRTRRRKEGKRRPTAGASTRSPAKATRQPVGDRPDHR